jgi:hypothetical protein
MELPNRMSLHPGLLLLAQNLALIIQCLSQYNIYIYIYINIFNFTYSVRYFRVPPGVRVPKNEEHCSGRKVD